MVTVRGLNPGRSFVPIVGDDLRGMHPEYDRLVDADPMRMPEVTAEASRRWVEATIEDARSLRRSAMVEGTFRRPGVTGDAASNFRSAGFDVHLVALAVPDWESRMAIVDRYVVDHASGRQARGTAPRGARRRLRRHATHRPGCDRGRRCRSCDGVGPAGPHHARLPYADRDLLGAMEARRIAGTGVPPQAGRGAAASNAAAVPPGRGRLRLVEKDADVER